jgi:hypothetical protein
LARHPLKKTYIEIPDTIEGKNISIDLYPEGIEIFTENEIMFLKYFEVDELIEKLQQVKKYLSRKDAP